ncbi:Receptor-type tyrosine-protein kinase FLT3 [Lonchura striata]|uniref:Receptor-type tyrosine-protein kinase FLT3 n=1 Tax=Lonchura striata TaxID=40157 RepID=A0A218V6T7_9PASE|nr:Receptor-type tyrosine-protein kinase FLT3 [Lonchura striata domestica]
MANKTVFVMTAVAFTSTMTQNTSEIMCGFISQKDEGSEAPQTSIAPKVPIILEDLGCYLNSQGMENIYHTIKNVEVNVFEDIELRITMSIPNIISCFWFFKKSKACKLSFDSENRYITSLVFSQIKEGQAGKYTLLVTSKSGNYRVVVPVLIQNLNERQAAPLPELLLKVSEPLLIRCRAVHQNYKFRIQLSFENREVEQGCHFEGLEYQENFSAIRIQYVFVSAAEKNDSGHYTCSSTAHLNQTALITVLEKGFINITDSKEDFEIGEEEFCFEVNFTAYPPVRCIISSKFCNHQHQSGIYVFYAENDDAVATKKFTLYVRRPIYLIFEYCCYGDLLNYLRSKREKFHWTLTDIFKQQNFSFYHNIHQDQNSRTGTHLRYSVNTALCREDECETMERSQNINVTLGSNGIVLFSEEGKIKDASTPMDEEEDFNVLTFEDLLCFSYQVAKGMEFLESKSVYHNTKKNLATHHSSIKTKPHVSRDEESLLSSVVLQHEDPQIEK